MGVNSLVFVAAAYGVIWVVLFVYLATIHQRIAALRQELEAATRRSEPESGRVPPRVAAQDQVAP